MNQHDAASFSALVDQQLEAAKGGLEDLLALPSGASAEDVSRTFDGIGREVGEVSGLAELFSAQGAIFTKGVDQFKDLKDVKK